MNQQIIMTTRRCGKSTATKRLAIEKINQISDTQKLRLTISALMVGKHQSKEELIQACRDRMQILDRGSVTIPDADISDIRED